MKKILSSILAVAMIVLSAISLTGCSKDAKNFSTEGIISNGGIAVIKDGFMYYIAGGTDKFEDPSESVIVASSIYKRAVDAAGNPVDGSEPVLLYKGVAGFEYGGLYAFGDYLYFTIPSSKVTSTAEKMTDHTSFARIRMDGKKFKVLHTTETADDLKYAYYLSGEELFIAVLEGEELYSYNVKKNKVIEIASGVTSVVFSSTFGAGTGADPYIFYTSTPGTDYLTQNGNLVYKTTITGENTEKISAGSTVSLLDNKFGYLYFAKDDKIYRTTTAAGLDQTNVVSHRTYETNFFTANGGMVAAGKDSDTELVYFVWENAAKVNSKVLASTKGYTPYFVDGDILYAIDNNKKLVRLTLDFGATETAKDTIIKDEVTVSVGAGLNPEKVGNYLYYYTETKTTDDNGNEISVWNLQSVRV